MALSIHVISHKRTNVVLAAYSRGDTDAKDSLTAVVGKELPIAFPDDTVTDAPSLGAIDVAELAEDKVPGDPTLSVGSVLDAPLLYFLKRDPQGQVQSLELGTAIGAGNVTANGTLISITLPSDIEINGRPGFIRLRDSTGTIHDTDVTVTPSSNSTLKSCTATVNAPAGTYTMLLLVQGFPGLIKTAVTIT